MSKEFDVNMGKLKEIADDYQKICNIMENCSESIQNISNAMREYSYGSVRNNLSNMIQNNNRYINQIKQLGDKLALIALQYEQTENEILNYSVLNAKPINDSNSSNKVSGSISYIEKESENGNLKGSVFTAEGEAGLESLRAYAEGSAAVAKGEAGIEGKYGAGSVEGSFLEVQGEASFGIPNSFSIGSDEAKTAGLVVSAAGTVIAGNAEGYLGLEDMNVHGNAEGSLLGAGAGAEAGLTLGDGEIGIKAGVEAEAYLAKGEVSGGFTLFGIDIDIGAEVMAGVQVEAGVELASTDLNFGLGAGPVGLDIAIDWSDFDLTFWD